MALSARVAVVALTGSAGGLARRIATALDAAEVHGLQGRVADADRFFSETIPHLRALFAAGRPIAGICAAGILVRAVAPILGDKRAEPPVVAVSDDGAFAVPLLGGHQGGVELARRIADIAGGVAAITTAGDNRFGIALDRPPEGWTLANPQHYKPFLASVLQGARVRVRADAGGLAGSRPPTAGDDAPGRPTGGGSTGGPSQTILQPPVGDRLARGDRGANGVRPDVADNGVRPDAADDAHADTSAELFGRWLAASRLPIDEAGELEIRVGDGGADGFPDTLVYRPRRLAVGIGCERGTAPEEVTALARACLEGAGFAPEAVAGVFSIDLKSDEPAVHALSETLGVPARFLGAVTLEAEAGRLRNPSEFVFREVGCHGVAEGAALAAAGPRGELVVEKTKSLRATCAIARAPSPIDTSSIGSPRGELHVVGIGPGDAGTITPRARAAVERAGHVVGYRLYLDLVADLIAGATTHPYALGEERDRVAKAIELAAGGTCVALVCSGDPGVYAMASLVMEMLDGAADPAWGRIAVRIVPGVSALQAAAAGAGAPIGHDFCAVSLSDLLTPRATIETRLAAAAAADFVIALYNPVSRARRETFERALAILREHRAADTPVVVARNLGRTGERISVVALGRIDSESVNRGDIDMMTVLLVGSSRTRTFALGDTIHVYTPRGYEVRTGGAASGATGGAASGARRTP